MATTRPTLASLAKQTERLLLQAGLCPKHPKERLWCGPCHLSWEGTPQEFDELIALAERLPYDRSPGPTPYRCAHCQERLWCDACFRAEMARLPSREVTMPLSDEELARYHKLSAYLAFKDHAEGLPPIRLHWGDAKPQEATAPDGMISPPAGLSGDPKPQEATAPAPEPEPADDGDADKELPENFPEVPDADADVDAELADLLAQLQRRLGR
jgi:hypothetical protein